MYYDINLREDLMYSRRCIDFYIVVELDAVKQEDLNVQMYT